MCKRDSCWESTVEHRGLSPVLCGDREGQGEGVGWRLMVGAGGGGYMYTYSWAHEFIQQQLTHPVELLYFN